MSIYVVNLDRLMSMSLRVDVEDPEDALSVAENAIKNNEINWDDAPIDQISGCCLATGDGTYYVLSQKNAEV